MIYKAHELLSHLNHLTLTATDGKEEWIGTDEQRNKVKKEIEDRNNCDVCEICDGEGTMPTHSRFEQTQEWVEDGEQDCLCKTDI